MRAATHLLAAIALVALAAAPASAQSMPAGHPPVGDAGAPEPKSDGKPIAVKIDALALDYTQSLMSMHGGQDHGSGAPREMEKIPLEEAKVGAIIGTLRLVEGQIGPDGRLTMDLGEVPPGTEIQLQATVREGDAERYFYAPPFEPDGEVPTDEVKFFASSSDSSRVVQTVMQIVTVRDDIPGYERCVQMRQTIQLFNIGFSVFHQSGDYGFAFPVPEGFEVAEFMVDGADAKKRALVDIGHAGKGLPYKKLIFPTVGEQRPSHTFFGLLRREFEEGDVFDLAGHIEVNTQSFSTSLEVKLLNYEPNEKAAPEVRVFEDGGVQPPMGATQKITHTWFAEMIPAHTQLDGTVRVTEASIPVGSLLIVLLIVLLAGGGIALGVMLGRDDGESVGASGATATATPGDDRLEQLERRFKDGEITSVEYDVRKKALTGGGAATAKPAPSSTAAAAAGGGLALGAAAKSALARQLDEIVNRPDDASPEQRAEDIRALARVVRDLIG